VRGTGGGRGSDGVGRDKEGGRSKGKRGRKGDKSEVSGRVGASAGGDRVR
jgi:hypothetical protein